MTRRRAEKPVQYLGILRNVAGMACAFGARYGASTPRDFKISVRTGSLDQNTSACGRVLLGEKLIRQPRRLGFLRIVDGIDRDPRLPFIFAQYRLREHPVCRHADGDRIRGRGAVRTLPPQPITTRRAAAATAAGIADTCVVIGP